MVCKLWSGIAIVSVVVAEESVSDDVSDTGTIYTRSCKVSNPAQGHGYSTSQVSPRNPLAELERSHFHFEGKTITIVYIIPSIVKVMQL